MVGMRQRGRPSARPLQAPVKPFVTRRGAHSSLYLVGACLPWCRCRRRARKKPSFRSMPLSDQIDTLHKRAAELDFKQTLTSLNRLIMEKRGLLPGIVRHLQGRGVELPRAATLRSKRAQEPEGSPTEQADANDHPEPAGPPAQVRRCGVKDPNPHKWLPHAYTRLDNCKSPVLEKLLTSLEEIAFSQYALKGLRGKEASSTEY